MRVAHPLVDFIHSGDGKIIIERFEGKWNIGFFLKKKFIVNWSV